MRKKKKKILEKIPKLEDDTFIKIIITSISVIKNTPHTYDMTLTRETTPPRGKTSLAFACGFLLCFLLFHADVFNHRQSIVSRWRGISNDLVLEREHCRQVLAEHRDALSSVHEEIESLKGKNEETSGQLQEKHNMLTHASNLLEEKHLELEHKTTQLEVMKEALSEADVDGHNSAGSGSGGGEEEEDDALSEEEPAEQPTGRSSRGSGGKHSSKRGGHGRRNSRKSASAKPHGGEEHGEDDLENGDAHEETDTSEESATNEEVDISTE